MNRRPDISPKAVAIWKFLRDSGGYWTNGEIARVMAPNLENKLGANKVGQSMRALHNRRCVAMNPRAIRVPSYGVTSLCFAPEGESLEPHQIKEHRS